MRDEMNISSCYPNLTEDSLSLQMFPNIVDRRQDLDQDDNQNSQLDNRQANSLANSLLFNLSILKDKVHNLQSLLAIILSPATTAPGPSSSPSPSIAMATMNMHNTVQDIIMTSSSMLLTIQQQAAPIGLLSGNSNPNPSQNNNSNILNPAVSSRSILGTQSMMYPSSTNYSNHQNPQPVFDWTYGHHQEDPQNFTNSTVTTSTSIKEVKSNITNATSYDIIELDATDLLAKYTHYCRVCGKGFKRDANLRMHMRAHGDEYKTSAALTNPSKKKNSTLIGRDPSKKYSCPQEGCRWNQRHAKFQPLKSMICAKNHYKRSHCPKMYVCKRCSSKQFSVLSDLRTHEKHCGDLKWQCSCGTTFSRKDKLMGHVSLFHGHAPIVLNNNSSRSSSASANSVIRVAKTESQGLMSQAQIDNMLI